MTNTPAISGALPDLGVSLVRVVGALGVVIALFLVGVWLFRNWQRLAWRKGAPPKLAVLEVKTLGQRQSLFIVGYEQQRMLIASSSAGITLLSHLPAAESEPAAAAAPKMGFAEALQQVLARKA